MVDALSNVLNWHKNLSPITRYLTFRCGMSILGFALFALILLGSKNVPAAAVYAGQLTAFVATLASLGFVRTDVRFMSCIFCVFFTELVFLLGLIFMFSAIFLYSFLENLEGALVFEPISWDGWSCLAVAAIITLATGPYDPTPENTGWRAQNTLITLNSTIGLLILNTAVFAFIMKIVL
ncbi:hypothetical protein A3C09_04445 [Candidatus Uhrbacteria bacterium RIFCSPHIGHO2_02_FULL_47_44]|uniref:Uncharacterized protein n=1 Tax=Candidatus Uhrbacteria bacterium RIFCSPLOWO2_02_FULL_48_18 TaxID=1802408 RepID=A0A1F7VCK8_9BACT|nr:MAG: hypothetical protein A2839_02145 [Candidatus Uhrbacteria bacterium RIFCSPHIGHO2_01_FULL_47_10]OGL70155.1 MAG: hypothetical protein A3C09_04445 [Candidatus Uhrbacteria bacterium RIFCSPHIGHO2_02_FULL_47_44]OGL80654.1 MAG: hypothetical protein A3B20_04650 [Candidatus Uhrbacteria bacterium RIFCSPLOWO2_01_FULL_47_17]OGL88163.1 MAG: hypothetical protein A3I41_00330 [Candidatus Uhrbacteria bacterium RIFCSPLOWO2_02_FULL_48_18]OGL92221.1 MAG: hypothetical protein A3H12_04600 [Candidatus Uhrbacte